MIELIENIAERCHHLAEKRGKDFSAMGCMFAAGVELQEFWDAIDCNRLADINGIENIVYISSDEIFKAEYDKKLHNTQIDELADLVIIAATWLWEAKTEEGVKEFIYNRSLDGMFIEGILYFVNSQCLSISMFRALRKAVLCKMRYNALRED